MASKVTNVGLVLILVVMLWGETMAQSGCTTALIGLAPCLSFVSGNSSTPSSSCCSQLSNVVQAQPRCLCSLLNGGGANLGISINQTLALSLPSACDVQTPPVSQCDGVANGPTPSSVESPTSNSPPGSSSDEIPEAPTSTSKPTIPTVPTGGSKSVPSSGGDTSNGVIVRAPIHVLVYALVVVSCTSVVTNSLSTFSHTIFLSSPFPSPSPLLSLFYESNFLKHRFCETLNQTLPFSNFSSTTHNPPFLHQLSPQIGSPNLGFKVIWHLADELESHSTLNTKVVTVLIV
ncbi:hypothetical protein L6452_04267 [Arctium lappa]|uniref:Uncharacterized protein n=1 Tax=Arctium lappa TaxID=4217 RepID=A0ACB9FP63_ARCLA|nr:hypothetical protein L6452_04267 [Arctium lappa]